MFEASGLKKEYDDGQVQALRGVDFRIQQGEFVAIVGPSGSGKSTLLQMLGALDHPSAGTLKYRGASLAERADLASYRAHEIGFIFQAFHLLPTFTALENVQIPMFETHRSVSERKHRAIELLKAGRTRNASPSFSRQALRRRTPARRHRPQPRQWRVSPARRRADGQSRQRKRGPDPRPDRGSPPRAEIDAHPGDSRPGHRPPGRAHHRDEGRPHRLRRAQ